MLKKKQKTVIVVECGYTNCNTVKSITLFEHASCLLEIINMFVSFNLSKLFSTLNEFDRNYLVI